MAEAVPRIPAFLGRRAASEHRTPGDEAEFFRGLTCIRRLSGAIVIAGAIAILLAPDTAFLLLVTAFAAGVLAALSAFLAFSPSALHWRDEMENWRVLRCSSVSIRPRSL